MVFSLVTMLVLSTPTAPPQVPRLVLRGGGKVVTLTDPRVVGRVLDATDCSRQVRSLGRDAGKLSLGMLSFNRGEGIVSSLGTDADGEIIFLKGEWVRRDDAWQYQVDPALQSVVDAFIERMQQYPSGPLIPETQPADEL